jgi:diketogulonate reductase-like aldo/keto reductase
VRTVELSGGEAIPLLGLGTWHMGENAQRFDQEVAAVRYAMDRGVRLIDTAEMYGDGGAEQVVGEATRDCRDDVFIVSKVCPHNASYDGVIQACENSMRRLGTDRIDLYLLHWRGQVPFSETLDAFETLQEAGKIRTFGVSNFDATDMAEWWSCPSGEASVANQVLYNLGRRGVEWDVVPGCRDRGVTVIAYSPLEQGRLQDAPVLTELALRHAATPLQIALAWVLAQPGVIAIPKAVNHAHIDQNLAALDIVLNVEDHALLDATFPPPSGPSHLDML